MERAIFQPKKRSFIYMIKVQIIENEDLLKYADFDTCEIWLLNRTTSNQLDSRVINEKELTESALPSNMKFPQLLGLIWERHPNKESEIEQDGVIIPISEMTFSYEIITKNKDNFLIQSYVCSEECIKVVPA